jgi:hypothetical protein
MEKIIKNVKRGSNALDIFAAVVVVVVVVLRG